jgi:hypothetical protein
MKIIDRYVFGVTRNLPQKQREDIEKELRTLIEDMMSEYDNLESEEKKAEQVLLELGDPNILAEKYSDRKRYLIGPQNFDNYILVLKIVLGSILLAVSVGYVLYQIFSANEINIFNNIINYLGSLMDAALQGLVWVTGIFAILEYKGVKTDKDNLKGDTWRISDLPEIPENKAVISKTESVVSIIFSTIFVIVLYFAPQYFGVYILDKSSGYTIIPFFNIEVLNGYKILIFAVFLTILTKEILKIIAGRWSLKLSLSVAALNIAGLLIMVTIFLNAGIFNNNLPAEVLKSANLGFDAAAVWNAVRKWFLVFFIGGSIIDTIVVLYKGVRYNPNS